MPTSVCFSTTAAYLSSCSALRVGVQTLYSAIQSKVYKVNFFVFVKFMKRPQTKVHVETMSDSKVIRSKKV